MAKVELSSQELWQLIRGEKSPIEALTTIGFTEDKAKEMIGSLSYSSFNAFFLSMAIKKECYARLVEMGEIDKNDYFSLATHKIDDNPSIGDLSLKDYCTYTYTGKDWIKI